MAAIPVHTGGCIGFGALCRPLEPPAGAQGGLGWGAEPNAGGKSAGADLLRRGGGYLLHRLSAGPPPAAGGDGAGARGIQAGRRLGALRPDGGGLCGGAVHPADGGRPGLRAPGSGEQRGENRWKNDRRRMEPPSEGLPWHPGDEPGGAGGLSLCQRRLPGQAGVGLSHLRPAGGHH